MLRAPFLPDRFGGAGECDAFGGDRQTPGVSEPLPCLLVSECKFAALEQPASVFESVAESSGFALEIVFAAGTGEDQGSSLMGAQASGEPADAHVAELV